MSERKVLAVMAMEMTAQRLAHQVLANCPCHGSQGQEQKVAPTSTSSSVYGPVL